MKTKLFTTALLILVALLAMTTMISADYTTDNNTATTTDYLIMEADDVKLATGTKGTVVYDENGYKIAQYQPSETYVQPESGWVTITPANANAGYAATGANSFFDFPYTVLYYRTSATAAATGNLMLTGNSTFKWNGGAHIKRQTTYGGIIIDRDSYTTGNPAAITPYDNTFTKQGFTLKTFPTADVKGTLDILAIASFRTKAQAEAFISEYEPYVHSYKSDNNPETELDYVIMTADDIKLATGDKGTVTTDSGNSVLLVTPAESYKSPENGQIKFYPANAGIGIESTGENSLYDFNYYVFRYKTEGAALSTINTMLSGKAGTTQHYKWNGTQLTSMSDYGFFTIERTTFTSGNQSGHSSNPDTSWTEQAINLKAFQTASVTGKLLISELAIFRTKAQADYYIENYGKLDNTEPDTEAPEYLVLNSSELSSIAKYNGVFTESSSVDYDKKQSFIIYTANQSGAHQDSTSFEFDTAALAGNITLKEYPVIKISYKAKATSTSAKIDLNVGLDYLGVATRIWGPKLAFTRDETHTSMIINVPDAGFTGGENLSGTAYSYDSIDDTSTYNYLRFKPFYGTSFAKGDYFAIEYIGFFKSEADANAYVHTIDLTLKSIDLKYDAYKLKPGASVQNDVTFDPIFADVTNVEYKSSNDSVATVDSTGLIKAVSNGKATITVTDKETGLSATCDIIVETPTPIDWYSVNSTEGESIVLNVIGDSISYGNSTTNKAYIYHGRWATDFKMQVNNWSRGGAAVTGNYLYKDGKLETFVPRMERMIANDVGTYDTVVTNEDPDMIVIYGGTNDYNGYWALGSVGDTTRKTYCGAISELITLTWKHYPNAKLVFFTPIKRTDYTLSNGQDNTGKRQHELDAYVDAMIETCEYYDVPCIDLYNLDQANLTGLRTTYIKDGVHMTDEGHRIFAKLTIEEMEKAGVIKTHGYTAAPASTYALDANRDLSADSHIFDATALNTLTTYNAGTLLDRQRMSKHTLTEGALRFSAETLTSKLAPSVTVDFAQLDFSVTDYPYMTVVYKTDSTAAKIGLELRGADNKVSRISDAQLPKLVSDKKGAFTVNLKDFSSNEISLDGTVVNSDLYMPMFFFEDTYSMTAESYVDIESIAFFKTADDADAYKEEQAPDEVIIGDCDNNGEVDSNDLVVISRYLANWDSYDELIKLENSDVNNDNGVSSEDSVVLARHLAKWTGYLTLPVIPAE